MKILFSDLKSEHYWPCYTLSPLDPPEVISYLATVFDRVTVFTGHVWSSMYEVRVTAVTARERDTKTTAMPTTTPPIDS